MPRHERVIPTDPDAGLRPREAALLLGCCLEVFSKSFAPHLKPYGVGREARYIRREVLELRDSMRRGADAQVAMRSGGWQGTREDFWQQWDARKQQDKRP